MWYHLAFWSMCVCHHSNQTISTITTGWVGAMHLHHQGHVVLDSDLRARKLSNMIRLTYIYIYRVYIAILSGSKWKWISLLCFLCLRFVVSNTFQIGHICHVDSKSCNHVHTGTVQPALPPDLFWTQSKVSAMVSHQPSIKILRYSANKIAMHASGQSCFLGCKNLRTWFVIL